MPACSICLDSLYEHRVTLLSPCGHMFHQSCIERNMNHNIYCPSCRGYPRNFHRAIVQESLEEEQTRAKAEQATAALQELENLRTEFNALRLQCSGNNDLKQQLEELKHQHKNQMDVKDGELSAIKLIHKSQMDAKDGEISAMKRMFEEQLEKKNAELVNALKANGSLTVGLQMEKFAHGNTRRERNELKTKNIELKTKNEEAKKAIADLLAKERA